MTNITQTTAAETIDPRFTIQSSAQPYSIELISGILKENLRTQSMAYVTHFLMGVSQSTGDYVKLLPEHSFFPVLIGSDGRPIPLFSLVEALDGVIDYDSIKEELPTLSYAQINSAISFLRKLAQFNFSGVDFDQFEDDDVNSDQALLEQIRNALADKENVRVLRHD